MITKTQIANTALAYLSAGTITNILDNDDAKSRVINAVFDQTAKEVIRSHRWSCCVRRATLSRLSENPTKVYDFGYSYRYQLPSDSLRFLDLNGEPWSAKAEFFDINGKELHTDEPTVNIRYLAWEPNTEVWDVLLAEAVAIKIAMRVARQITKDGMSGEQLLKVYEMTLSKAMHVDAMELGSGENRPLERMLKNSPIVNSGQNRYWSRNQRLGLGVDYSVDRDA
jgi:hypothetical protein